MFKKKIGIKLVNKLKLSRRKKAEKSLKKQVKKTKNSFGYTWTKKAFKLWAYHNSILPTAELSLLRWKYKVAKYFKKKKKDRIAPKRTQKKLGNYP